MYKNAISERKKTWIVLNKSLCSFQRLKHLCVYVHWRIYDAHNNRNDYWVFFTQISSTLPSSTCWRAVVKNKHSSNLPYATFISCRSECEIWFDSENASNTPLYIWWEDYSTHLHWMHTLRNRVTIYQTRKHIILWPIIHSLLIDPKKSARKKSMHILTDPQTHAKQRECESEKKTSNLNSEKQTNANNKRSATKQFWMLTHKKMQTHMRSRYTVFNIVDIVFKVLPNKQTR